MFDQLRKINILQPRNTFKPAKQTPPKRDISFLVVVVVVVVLVSPSRYSFVWLPFRLERVCAQMRRARETIYLHVRD